MACSAFRSFGLWLNEPEDVAVRVTNVEFNAVGHLAQRYGKRDTRRLEGHGKRLRVLNDEAGVDGLVALESGEVTWGGMSAPEMNVAAVAADTGVELLVAEVQVEAELVAVKGERAPQIWNSENRRDVGDSSKSVIHRAPHS